MSSPVVGFAGMTHLGLVSATAVAAKGFRTICFDADAALTNRLRAGQLPVIEPGLGELLRANGDRQVFTSEIAALSDCDVVYVAPDVPTDDDGRSDLDGIRRLIDDVAARLRTDAIFVVLCQVPPGFTRSLAVPPPERRFYQVETLVFGRAVERAMHPERYIVGCAEPDRPLPPALAGVLGAFQCPILPMRYESAELAKISINMCLVASISVANTLAELCESIGAVWSEIVPALRLDRRIGAHSYLSPGLGVAGGNLERDLATVMTLAERNGTDSGVVAAWLRNSRHRRDWAARTLEATALARRPDTVVAIWGLAYKENTHSVKNSPSVATIAQFPTLRLRLHDPVVPVEKAAHPNAVGAATALEAASGADVLMILTPWPEYRKLDIAALAHAMAGRTIIDPYAVLDGRTAAGHGFEYHTLGAPALRPAPSR